MSDGKIDGRFIIRQGGITQGIAEELGLNAKECKKLGSVWTQIIQEMDNSENMTTENNQNTTPDKSNNYLVHRDAVIQFSKASWNKIVNLVNQTLNKNIQVESSDEARGEEVSNKSTKELTQEQISRKEAHSKVVKEAVDLLEKNWELTGLGEHFKTKEDKELYLKCLKEVVYDAERQGAGHAENGVIHIETNNEQVNSKAEMFKLLVHEANHAFLQRKAKQNNTLNFPTKAEELECETLALTATAKMVNAGKLDNYEIYNHPISYYTSSDVVENTPGIQDWLQGYNKNADNLNGDITIQHHPSTNIQKAPAGTITLGDDDGIVIEGEQYTITSGGKLTKGSASGKKEEITSDATIKYRGKLYKLSVQNKEVTEIKNSEQVKIEGGDVFEIEGLPPITIGQDAMLEGKDNTSVTQLLIHHKDFSTPTLLGTVIFDDVEPTQEELNMSNSNNLDNNNSVRFVIRKKDGTEIKGVCYPDMDKLQNIQEYQY